MKKHFWDTTKGWIEFSAGAVTVLSIVVSAYMYVMESSTRKREAVFGAWNIVTSTEGKRANGGRLEALRQLRASGESMAGVVLDGAILESLDLCDTTLVSASLKNVEFNEVSLSGCDLTNASFLHAQMRSCTFVSAQLHFAQLGSAVLADCDLVGVVLHGAIGDDRTSFNGARMRSCLFSNSSFPGSVFDNADLSESHAIEVSFEGASFNRAVVDGWQWIAVRATGARLQNVQGSDCRFRHGTVLANTRFDQSTLANATFEQVDLRGASFFAAKLPRTMFRDCDLSGADFSSAELHGVTFTRCNVDRVVLMRAIGLQDGTFLECHGQTIIEARE